MKDDSKKLSDLYLILEQSNLKIKNNRAEINTLLDKQRSDVKDCINKINGLLSLDYTFSNNELYYLGTKIAYFNAYNFVFSPLHNVFIDCNDRTSEFMLIQNFIDFYNFLDKTEFNKLVFEHKELNKFYEAQVYELRQEISDNEAVIVKTNEKLHILINNVYFLPGNEYIFKGWDHITIAYKGQYKRLHKLYAIKVLVIKPFIKNVLCKFTDDNGQTIEKKIEKDKLLEFFKRYRCKTVDRLLKLKNVLT